MDYAQLFETLHIAIGETSVILEQIVAATRRRLAEQKNDKPLSELERQAKRSGNPRDFKRALEGEKIKLIAEVKRASPSKGWLCRNLEVKSLTSAYAEGGAAAISVLTEPAFFKGSLEDLALARETVDLPLLRKDFIIEPCQVYEARLWGADAILLISAILSPFDLGALLEIAQDLNMSALVEVHNEEELKKALAAQARLIGINNRNLADFSVDLKTTLRLRPLIPLSTVVVSESGIHSRADLLDLQAAKVNAVLVGEALVTTPNPAAKIKELLGNQEI